MHWQADSLSPAPPGKPESLGTQLALNQVSLTYKTVIEIEVVLKLPSAQSWGIRTGFGKAVMDPSEKSDQSYGAVLTGSKYVHTTFGLQFPVVENTTKTHP